MTTRILILEDEDAVFLSKLISNLHRRLENNPSDPAVSEHLMVAHRLQRQFIEGLPTERQYILSVRDAELKLDQVEAKKRADKRAKLKAKGINVTSTEEPAPRPEKPAKASTRASKQKDAVPCSEHNNSGARAPRSDCKGCWSYYRHLHPERYDEAWKKHKAKKKKA